MKKQILEHTEKLISAKNASAVMQLKIYSDNSLNKVSDFLRDLQVIARKAETEGTKATNAIANISGVSNMAELSDAAKESMKELHGLLKNAEVYDDVTN